jgi:Domain of unknown function (DUF4249)
MHTRAFYQIMCFTLIGMFSCKQHYTLPAEAIKQTNYLVVEGNINVGQDSTIITLTRSVPVTDTTKALVPEMGAAVAVETDAGRTFPLVEIGNGAYAASNIPLGAASEKYSLHITTAGNRQYRSSYVVFKKAPAIDSVSWEQHDDGVHIYVNTHDDENKSQYYKWNFTEVWEYHAPFSSSYEYKDGIEVRRPAQVQYCWQTVASTAVIMQNTNNLATDVVYQKQLMFIPTSDHKLGVLYTMLVSQNVLTKEGFDYWTGLSKNSEQLGSIFDAQPSQLAGNLYCVTDPTEPVVGFITATTTQQYRLWIKHTEVKNWQYPLGKFAACDTAHLDRPGILALVVSNVYAKVDLLPFSTEPPYATSIECVDCTLQGGVNVKPAFWP